MAVLQPTYRRYLYGRYFGDGAYPTAPRAFVLTDRNTGLFYRVTAPGMNFSLVNISALSANDEKVDVLAVPSDDGVTFWNLYSFGGIPKLEVTPNRSRPPFIQDGGNRYKLGVNTAGNLYVFTP